MAHQIVVDYGYREPSESSSSITQTPARERTTPRKKARRKNRRFFYLVTDSGKNKLLSADETQPFFRVGSKTDSKWVFVFVDIAQDHRLREDMETIDGGTRFFREEIKFKAPVLLITTAPLRSCSIDKIQTVAFDRFEQAMDRIYAEMGVHAPTTRKAVIRFLKQVNRYGHLKPNIFGMGVNFNEIISDLIENWEEKMI